MKFKNVSKAFFAGFNAFEDPQFPGKPIRIQPGKVGEFSHRSKSVDLAVEAGVLVPHDKETKELYGMKGK